MGTFYILSGIYPAELLQSKSNLTFLVRQRVFDFGFSMLQFALVKFLDVLNGPLLIQHCQHSFTMQT